MGNESCRRFLGTVWPEGVSDGQDLLIWTLPDKLSRWSGDLAYLAAESKRLAAGHDVYIGIGAGRRPETRAERQRLTQDKVLTVPGHVADLDYGKIGHQKRGLFRDEAEASAFLQRLPLQPTVVVHSGGGLQAWWLYKEPWEFDGDRDQAYAIARGWTEYLKDEARQQKRAIDSVHDLSRVMRIPGTLNHKAGHVRPVRLLAADGRRYDPTEFEPWEWSGYEVRPEWLDLQPSPELDASTEKFVWWSKLQALCKLDVKFKLTWTRQRETDFPSPSEYDFSIATKLWSAGWSEQEILDALIHWRRLHRLESKRLQYYTRHTIPKAAASEWAQAERQFARAGKRHPRRGKRHPRRGKRHPRRGVRITVEIGPQ